MDADGVWHMSVRLNLREPDVQVQSNEIVFASEILVEKQQTCLQEKTFCMDADEPAFKPEVTQGKPVLELCVKWSLDFS